MRIITVREPQNGMPKRDLTLQNPSFRQRKLKISACGALNSLLATKRYTVVHISYLRAEGARKFLRVSHVGILKPPLRLCTLLSIGGVLIR